MGILDRLRPGRGAVRAVPDAAAPEARARTVAEVFSSDSGLSVQIFGLGDGVTDEVVTVDTALTVPSMMCAVSFLSRTLSTLPVKAYEKTDTGRDRLTDDPVALLLSRAASDEVSGTEFRRQFWQDVFTWGRGVAFIEKDRAGRPINLHALDVSKLTITAEGRGRKSYHYRDGARVVTYRGSEVIDLPFMLRGNRLGAVSPVFSNAITIGLTLAMMRYAGRVFKNGGIPPFTISGPMKSPGAVDRAADQLTAAVKALADKGGNAITIPEGHELKPLGIDPEKMQMEGGRRFQIEEVARIYQMPPVFVGDLTRGTFSNVEQQDLHLVKHLVSQWAKLFEAEVTLKAYGRRPGIYVEHDLDGLLRGDLLTRATARAQMINTGQLLPNEARAQDNRPPVEGGDRALVQGAMVPLSDAGAAYEIQNGGSGNE